MEIVQRLIRTAYIFAASSEIAVTYYVTASNLPKPKGGGRWRSVKQVDDLRKSGLAGLDLDVLDRRGYQLLPRLNIVTVAGPLR